MNFRSIRSLNLLLNIEKAEIWGKHKIFVTND